MPSDWSSSPRRSFLRSLGAVSIVALSGCSQGQSHPSTDTASADGPEPPDSANGARVTFSEPASGWLEIDNESGFQQTVSIRVVEFTETHSEHGDFSTLTRTRTPPANGTELFDSEVALAAGERTDFGRSLIFPVPGGLTEYHVTVRLEDGSEKTLVFTNARGSGFYYLGITIESDGTISFGRVVA